MLCRLSPTGLPCRTACCTGCPRPAYIAVQRVVPVVPTRLTLPYSVLYWLSPPGLPCRTTCCTGCPRLAYLAVQRVVLVVPARLTLLYNVLYWLSPPGFWSGVRAPRTWSSGRKAFSTISSAWSMNCFSQSNSVHSSVFPVLLMPYVAISWPRTYSLCTAQ